MRTKTDPNSLMLVDDNYVTQRYGIINGKKILLPEPGKINFSFLNSYYVPLLSQRAMFLDGGTTVGDHGVNYLQRKEDQDTVFYDPNPEKVKETLIRDKIDYIYTVPSRTIESGTNHNFITVVFENKEIEIFKVNR